MKRTTKQIVWGLLDETGIIPATEIAEILDIPRGTACSARDRWMKSRKPVVGPQPSFRKPVEGLKVPQLETIEVDKLYYNQLREDALCRASQFI